MPHHDTKQHMTRINKNDIISTSAKKDDDRLKQLLELHAVTRKRYVEKFLVNTCVTFQQHTTRRYEQSMTFQQETSRRTRFRQMRRILTMQQKGAPDHFRKMLENILKKGKV